MTIQYNKKINYFDLHSYTNSVDLLSMNFVVPYFPNFSTAIIYIIF